MRLLLAAFFSALVLPVPAWSSQGPASTAPPPGWENTVSRTTDLTIAGKDAEVIAIYEGWVAKHPTFAAAHLMLGGAHESLASRAAGIADAVRDFGRLYGESYSGPLLREASALLDEALKRDPKHAYAAKTQALVVEVSGK